MVFRVIKSIGIVAYMIAAIAWLAWFVSNTQVGPITVPLAILPLAGPLVGLMAWDITK